MSQQKARHRGDFVQAEVLPSIIHSINIYRAIQSQELGTLNEGILRCQVLQSLSTELSTERVNRGPLTGSHKVWTLKGSQQGKGYIWSRYAH